MKSWKYLAVLALCLCCLLNAAHALTLGDTLDDFTVTTADGGSFTLSEELNSHDMVLINLWATWCPPCAMEFPYLEEAWQAHRAEVAVIALSIEPSDTPEALLSYAAEKGLHFPVGSDSDLGLSSLFSVSAIPTSIVVDRYGRVAFVEAGAQTSAGAFERLFAAFTGPDYSETRLLQSIPAAVPAAQPLDSASLDDALNVPGGHLRFQNSSDALNWPMALAEEEGRSALVSGNGGQDESLSAVLTTVTCGEGDALTFDFRTDTEAAFDLLSVRVDGQVVKSFGGHHPWSSWALPLTAGTHTVEFRYTKDSVDAEGADAVWLDNISLESGDSAAEKLAALPGYPTAEICDLVPVSGREITLEDPMGILPGLLGCRRFWIVGDTTAALDLLLTPDMDAESALVISNYDGIAQAVSPKWNGEAFRFVTRLDTVEETGYPYTQVNLYADLYTRSGGVCLFPDEESADAFVALLQKYRYQVPSWAYAE